MSAVTTAAIRKTVEVDAPPDRADEAWWDWPPGGHSPPTPPRRTRPPSSSTGVPAGGSPRSRPTAPSIPFQMVALIVMAVAVAGMLLLPRLAW